MPLFHIEKSKLTMAKPINFDKEKDIQSLIEKNLDEVFNCRFIESEFSTGTEHGGRIDTLALSEEDNPVIIEYKKAASSELVNQSLYYLSWIKDHKGDFQIAANKKLKREVKINWDKVRVICIAPEYKKYDIYAVSQMGANIELWQYKYYNTNTLYLEEIFKKSKALMTPSTEIENKTKSERKATQTRQNHLYAYDEHLNKCNDKTRILLNDLRDYILSIDESIEEISQKNHIAYKVSKNFVCVQTTKEKILLYLKINPKEIKIPKNGRDVTEKGHQGTGDFEITINNPENFEEAKKYIRMAFENIGG